MPLTQLDRVPALIVIDLQKGILGSLSGSAAAIVDRSAQLARAFREQHLPVVLVSVAGRAPGRTGVTLSRPPLPPDWTELLPELDQQPGDYLVTKQRVGAFIGTSLDELLRGRGVSQLFLTGVATSFGVESTGRSAYDSGYHVVFVTDAIADRDPEMHRHSVEKIFPRIGETATTEEVLAHLHRTA